jgi:hypothetical protein
MQISGSSTIAYHFHGALSSGELIRSSRPSSTSSGFALRLQRAERPHRHFRCPMHARRPVKRRVCTAELRLRLRAQDFVPVSFSAAVGVLVSTSRAVPLSAMVLSSVNARSCATKLLEGDVIVAMGTPRTLERLEAAPAS